MKKLLLVVVVVLASVLPAGAVVVYSDNFDAGWNGPDSLGWDNEARAPINWDRIASTPGNVFMKISANPPVNGNAMVLGIWGDSTCYIEAYSAAVIPAGTTALKFNLQTRGEGWGWHLTGLANGIFKDAGGNALGTVSVPFTDIANGVYLPTATDWVAREIFMAVPVGAASVKFQLENRRDVGIGQSGTFWMENLTVEAIPEPVTIGLLSLGALLIRGRKA